VSARLWPERQYDDAVDDTLLGWQERAVCAQTDPEAFFPEKGGSVRAAKKVCRACPVRAECLDYALEHHERFGVWGGLSERERRKLLPAEKQELAA
jgi:WhiB family redox-sensing transcriptional regulator